MDNENTTLHTCCFFGHRKINETKDLKDTLYRHIENLIIFKGVTTFLFGSKSQFDRLCHSIVTALQAKFPYIKRVYVRAEFPYINTDYKNYLLRSYEHTYYPESLHSAGKLVYVKRNYIMIDKSAFCIVYYDKNYKIQNAATHKSGTKIAYDYAMQKKKHIINIHR